MFKLPTLQQEVIQFSQYTWNDAPSSYYYEKLTSLVHAWWMWRVMYFIWHTAVPCNFTMMILLGPSGSQNCIYISYLLLEAQIQPIISNAIFTPFLFSTVLAIFINSRTHLTEGMKLQFFKHSLVIAKWSQSDKKCRGQSWIKLTNNIWGRHLTFIESGDYLLHFFSGSILHPNSIQNKQIFKPPLSFQNYIRNQKSIRIIHKSYITQSSSKSHNRQRQPSAKQQCSFWFSRHQNNKNIQIHQVDQTNISNIANNLKKKKGNGGRRLTHFQFPPTKNFLSIDLRNRNLRFRFLQIIGASGVAGWYLWTFRGHRLFSY